MTKQNLPVFLESKFIKGQDQRTWRVFDIAVQEKSREEKSEEMELETVPKVPGWKHVALYANGYLEAEKDHPPRKVPQAEH